MGHCDMVIMLLLHRTVCGVPGPPLHLRDDRPDRGQEEAAEGRQTEGAVPQPAPALWTRIQVIPDTR